MKLMPCFGRLKEFLAGAAGTVTGGEQKATESSTLAGTNTERLEDKLGVSFHVKFRSKEERKAQDSVNRFCDDSVQGVPGRYVTQK